MEKQSAGGGPQDACGVDSPESQSDSAPWQTLFQLCSDLRIVIFQEMARKLGTRGKFSGAPLRWHAGKGAAWAGGGGSCRRGLVNLLP